VGPDDLYSGRPKQRKAWWLRWWVLTGEAVASDEASTKSIGPARRALGARWSGNWVVGVGWRQARRRGRGRAAVGGLGSPTGDFSGERLLEPGSRGGRWGRGGATSQRNQAEVARPRRIGRRPELAPMAAGELLRPARGWRGHPCRAR
jgi:hypothetical protein